LNPKFGINIGIGIIMSVNIISDTINSSLQEALLSMARQHMIGVASQYPVQAMSTAMAWMI
jgi:histidine ammonia-lyase